MALSNALRDREYDKFLNDPDGNTAVRSYFPYSRYGQIVRKTLTLNGTAGSGGIGSILVFRTTGDVLFLPFATVQSDFSQNLTYVSLGTSGNTASLIGNTAGSSLTTGSNIWLSTTPAQNTLALSSATLGQGFITNSNIYFHIGSNATSGTMNLYGFYTPLSTNGSVAAG